MFKRLFVGGLPFVYSDGELKTLFAAVGTVRVAEMVYDPDRGRTRGFGFVEMATPEEALAAIEKLNGTKVGEKAIFVTEARERKPGQANAPASKPFPRKALRGQRPPSTPGSPYRERTPGTFSAPGAPGAPRSGFSRPPRWEPRADGKRSFSGPRNPRGDFGPSFGDNRRPRKPFGSRPDRPFSDKPRSDAPRSDRPRSDRLRSEHPSAFGKPPKEKFWQKFQKKKP